jgi:hypothetical protein
MSVTPNTTEQKRKAFLKALAAETFNVTNACVAAGIGRTTYYDWLKDAEFKQAVEDLEVGQKEFVEGQLMKAITGYEVEEDKIFVSNGQEIIVPTIIHVHPDIKAIQFYLETKAKDRGWQKRTEISGPNGGAIEMLPSITIGGPPKKEEQ